MRELTNIGAALDVMSMQWLNDNAPELAEALEREVQLGATPPEVRRYVMQQTQRLELALRCEQAARAMGSEQEG
ncbi:MAG: hypothetical protein JW900_04480 [Anaerolineae bacterium]|nr:hypothetical protein [Anaerolineae bacterium]